MKRQHIAGIYASPETFGGQTMTVCGWARTIRDMKNFGFIELNDGSCFKSLQVVLERGKLENYDEIARQNVGAAFIVHGELVLTPLGKQAIPVLRYRTHDLTRVVCEPCACGRTTARMQKVRSRCDDMLIIRGVNVFPSQIEQVIVSFPEIAAQYQIILTMNGPLDHVELQVETEPDFPIDEVRRLEDLRNRLAAALKSNLQVAVDIKFVEPKTIARSEGKAKRVIDLRGENQ